MKNSHILDLYSDYLISSYRAVTATGMSAMLEGVLSHDQITRFLSQDTFSQKDYWKCIKSIVRRIESDAGIIKIDDTIEMKPHSTENDIICWHYDHAQKGRDKNVKGIQIINFLYQSALFDYKQMSIPVAFEIINKTEKWYDRVTRKVKRRSEVTKNELVRTRLLILHQHNKVKFRYVLWDSWFSSAENFKFVHYDLKKYFVGAIKVNRKVALSQEDKRQGIYKRINELDLQKLQAIPVWLKGLDFPVRLTKQIFTNKDGSQGELYLVTNDLTLDANAINTIYQSRWGVEELHKSLKQNVGLEQSPTKVECTQSNHIFAAMIAWTKLEMMSSIRQTNHFALKTQLYVKAIKASFDHWQQLKQFQPVLASGTADSSPLLG